ncbi:MAG TPA: EVE domain-containing protein [Halothiobacillaceae bacterium]|nr:EVE domain-containing protein [Halothiobacillaceae bacterium]
MKYWLMKSEPDAFSIDDLKSVKVEPWDGIRNYQARNMIRDEMQPGDLAFFYHSNTKVPGIVGLMEIASEPRFDHTAFDPAAKYFDPKSNPDKPRWYLVDVKYIRHTKRVITLSELKAEPALENLPLVRRGNRLSIMPVEKQAFEHILTMEERPAEA